MKSKGRARVARAARQKGGVILGVALLLIIPAVVSVFSAQPFQSQSLQSINETLQFISGLIVLAILAGVIWQWGRQLGHFTAWRTALITVLLALSPALAEAALPVPLPTVEGPVPAVTPGDPSRNYPFIATAIDLASRGYVEEEYFISGTACRYNGIGLATATIRDCGFPYRTRIVVRRPINPKAFNGTVLADSKDPSTHFAR